MPRPRVCTGPWQRKAVYLWRGLCSLHFLGKHCHAGFVTQQTLHKKGNTLAMSFMKRLHGGRQEATFVSNMDRLLCRIVKF